MPGPSSRRGSEVGEEIEPVEDLEQGTCSSCGRTTYGPNASSGRSRCVACWFAEGGGGG